MILFDGVPILQYFTNLFNRDIDFEEENPAYRCARGAFHVVNVAKFFIILELIIIPIYVLFLFPYWVLWIGLHLILILITLYAIKKEKQRWIWPFIILAAAQFFVWTLITVAKFILGIFSTDYFLKLYGQGHHEEPLTRILIVVLIKAIVLLIGAWFFWRLTVFHTTRKYFLAKEEGVRETADPEQASGLEKLMKPV